MRVPTRTATHLVIVAILAAALPLMTPATASAVKAKKLTITDASVVEGDSGAKTMTFSLTWTGSKGGNPVSVKYATGGGTATAGSDYTATSGTVTLSNGCRCGTIAVSILGDAVQEGTEAFYVNLSAPVNATLQRSQGVGTIYDNEGPPALIVTDASADESAGTMSFSVLMTIAKSSSVTVDYATADGTAVAGHDSTSKPSSTLTFTPGQTSKSVSVTIANDALDEDDETFSVNLSNATGGTSITAPKGIGTILDDDLEPTISIAEASVVEGDTGTRALSFGVSLSAVSGRAVTVDYTTADGSAVGVTDFTKATGTVTFAAGVTAADVHVDVLGDTLYERDETLAVELTAPSNADIAVPAAVGSIVDDDPAPSLSVDDVTVIEGDSGTVDAVFAVTANVKSGLAASVDWATADGTATAGADYLANANTVTLDAGQKRATFKVKVVGDTIDELDETFSVTLSNPVDATIAGSNGTGTITDDERIPTTLTLKAKKTAKAIKAVGVIEVASTGMKIKVTLFRKQGAKYVKVLAKTVTVTKLGDRDADGSDDAAYGAAFKRPKKGAYRFVVKYAGSTQYEPCGKKLNVRL